MFKQMESAGLQDLHFWQDSVTGLRAIIAIHDTYRGPAIGGCRFISYNNSDEAVTDAIRLARGMSYKAALAGLPHGGGKAVLIKPDSPFDRDALMQSFGRFVDSLGGRYITAMDSGTQVSDMDNIARNTGYVTCTSSMGDPSPSTAFGVIAGIRASVIARYGTEDLNGLHVAIQGLGHVGYAVAQHLHEAGVQLTVADIDTDKVAQAEADLNARSVAPEEIYDVKANLFCPCGLGGIINNETLPRLNCDIIAGSANNQLLNEEMGVQLHQRGILYAPDYLINSGGLIFVALQHANHHEQAIQQKVRGIQDALLELYMHANSENLPTSKIADLRAESIIRQASITPFQAA